jgi:hypothetical protein
MDWKLFFIGMGFLTVAYLMYKWIKGKRPISQTNFKGPVPSVYFQYWAAVIMCAIGGIIFIIEAFW